MAEEAPTLQSFHISEKTGFLPETPPLTAFPAQLKEWNEIALQLSDLLREKQLRNAVHQLPDFNCDVLSTTEEWRSALVLLSGIFQGYMWQNGDKENELPAKMPSILSVPFHCVTQTIGTPLVGTYASTVLYNWRLLDSEKPMELENLKAIVNHTGMKDESWFFMVHVAIELAAVPAIIAVWNGIYALEKKNEEAIIDCLREIQSSLRKMKEYFNRMDEHCDPKVFYVNIRPFVAGTSGKAFPNGQIYEGVYGEKPQKFSGGSAAQSTTIKAFDIFLGVEHDDADFLKFLDEMKEYMPEKHRNFILYLMGKPSVRKYIEADGSNQELVMQYKSTIDALVAFRHSHKEIVKKFIVDQIEHTVNESLKEEGTGGMPLIKFLKSVQDDTKKAKMI